MKLKNPDNEKYIKTSLAIFAALAASLALFFVLFRIQGVKDTLGVLHAILMPFIYGAVFAYLLAPLCNFLKEKLLKILGASHEKAAEAFSILLAVVIAGVVIAFLLMLVLPQFVDSIFQLAQTLPGTIMETGTKLSERVANHPQLNALWEQYGTDLQARLENWTKTGLPNLAQRILDSVAKSLQQTFTLLKNLVLGILVSVYMLASRKRFAAQAMLLLNGMFAPHAAQVIEREVRYADRMFNGFLVGKIMDSAIIGIICFAGCWLLHLESPALIAVIIGVTNIIPFFGPFIGAIPCGLMLLIQNPIHCLTFLIFVLVLQQVDGNLIGPHILGDTTGLSSFWVLFSILLFGGLWGFVGMVVAVPLFAVIYDIIRQLVDIGLGRHGRSELRTAYDEAYHPEKNA